MPDKLSKMIGSVVKWRPDKSAPFHTFLRIKAVIVIGESHLGDVESASNTPLAHIGPHIHGSHNPFYPARRFAIQPFFNRSEHVGTGIL